MTDGLSRQIKEPDRPSLQQTPEDDPLLALYGSGKKLWADEHADDYVSRLRES
jgi:hypothetical protein